MLEDAAEALGAFHVAGPRVRGPLDSLVAQPLVGALSVVMGDVLMDGPAQLCLFAARVHLTAIRPRCHLSNASGVTILAT